MIARVAYFDPLTPEHHATLARNLSERVKPTITTQPGLVAAFWLTDQGRFAISLTIWESEETQRAAEARLNASPLPPGMRGEEIQGPARVELLAVQDYFLAAGRPAAD